MVIWCQRVSQFEQQVLELANCEHVRPCRRQPRPPHHLPTTPSSPWTSVSQFHNHSGLDDDNDDDDDDDDEEMTTRPRWRRAEIWSLVTRGLHHKLNLDDHTDQYPVLRWWSLSQFGTNANALSHPPDDDDDDDNDKRNQMWLSLNVATVNNQICWLWSGELFKAGVAAVVKLITKTGNHDFHNHRIYKCKN